MFEYGLFGSHFNTFQYYSHNVESISWELTLKPIIHNNNPIITTLNSFVRGTTVFRAHTISPGGNTHFPRTSVSRLGKAPTFCALQSRPNRPQSCPNRTPRPPAGFREPPYKPNWPRETPYATIVVFRAVRFTVRPGYPTRAGIPLRFCGLTPTLRILAPTVWVLSEQAHKSLYINFSSDTPSSLYPTDFPSFSIPLNIDSGHYRTSYNGFRDGVFAGRCTQQHFNL